MMRKTAGLLLIVLFIGCEIPKRNALGADNELMVVCSKERRNDMREILSAIFSDTIYTPQPEPVYKIKFIDPNSYGKIKRNVHIVFGSVGTDVSDPGTRLMKSLLSEDQFSASINGTNQLILSENVFASGQLVLFISGQSVDQILERAMVQGSKILDHFDTLYEKRQKKHLFEKARQKELENRLKSDYGWSMKIPWGYTILREEEESGLFWMGRDIPYRWIAVHWQEGLIAPTPDSASGMFHAFVSEVLESIQISDYKFASEEFVFNNWTSQKYTGIWEHKEEAQGGPFKGYLFYDGISNRTYILYTMVFHPGNDKSLLLKQLDLIAETFFVDPGGFE